MSAVVPAGDTTPTTGGSPWLVIRPHRSWLPADLRELWRFRGLLVRLGARDVTLRYRQTALGVTWVVLQPLLGAGVLSFVFGSVAGLEGPAGIPYFVVSFTGMVAWTVFSQISARASNTLVNHAAWIQKVYFPRILLPLSAALSTMADLAVSLALVAVLLAVYGIAPGLAVLTFPLWIALMIVAAVGISLVAGAVMVRFRDVQYVLPVVLQLALFLSPVAYTLDAVPESKRWLYQLNPLAELLEAVRWSLLGTRAPSVGLVAYGAGASLGVFFVGLLVFHRMERDFADVI